MRASSRKFLQYGKIFELFPLALRNTIYAKAEYREIHPGDYVFRVGEEGPFMACLASGRLRMSVTSREGKELLITMVEKGELVGEMSILDDKPRAVDVMAETDCTLMIVKRDDFLPILRTCPDAMIALIRITCYRMRRYLHTMELIALQDLPVRLGRYLWRLALDYGVEKDGEIVIAARLSQAEIGKQLAVSRESVNKQLHHFASLGLLSLKGTTITLHDVEGLKRAIAYVGG
ncbi:MAG: Crp/Fnr family transcriptional regulator [Alphaproteobacteria bacterium]|nr:Crp/Fnr family transcriptional regulator [Alphaproteobacteria bacterium]